MIKFVVVLSMLVALVFGQNAFSFHQKPLTLDVGQNYTTGFTYISGSSYSVGSQFVVYVPKNTSRVRIEWQRSPTTATCRSTHSAWLIGKYGSLPCPSDIYGLASDVCSDGYNTISDSSGESDTIYLNAYRARGLEYTISSPAIDDLIQGEYLYMASYVDSTDSGSCTATISVSFEGCPGDTIPAEDSATQSTKCVPYTNVTGQLHSETTSISNSPYEKYWLLHVPEISGGIRVTITSGDSNQWYKILGRLFVGGNKDRSYRSTSWTYLTRTLWIENPPAGELIISVVLDTTTGNFLYFDIDIEITTCASSYASDDAGHCIYPLYTLTPNTIPNIQVTVPPKNPATNSDCNWVVYAMGVSPQTSAFMNLTFGETGTSFPGKVAIRKNAFPTRYIYDLYTDTNYTFYFTPEDLYLSKPTIYYIGFCNDDTTEISTWEFEATYIPWTLSVPSPSPTPSASPAAASNGPSVSPSTSPSGTSSNEGRTGDNTAAIAGGVAGGASCLIIVVAVVVWYRKRLPKTLSDSESDILEAEEVN